MMLFFTETAKSGKRWSLIKQEMQSDSSDVWQRWETKDAAISAGTDEKTLKSKCSYLILLWEK